MSRAELSQTGETAPQRCPINMTWDLPQKIKKSFPDEEQQKGYNLFRVNKSPPDPAPRSQAAIPIPIKPRPASGPRAHLDKACDPREPTHSPTEAQLSPQAIGGSPPTLMDPASVAAHKPSAHASAGKRTGNAISKSNGCRNKRVGDNGFDAHGPLPSLPHPHIPSQQTVPSPYLRRSSYLAHRSQRTRRRGNGGPIDLDSDLRRLTPQEGDFGRRRLRDKLRILENTLNQVKAIEEALARRGTRAPAHAPGINSVGSVSAPQCGLATGSRQTGASYDLWAGVHHFDTTAIDPSLFSDRQRQGELIPEQHPRHQHTQHEDTWNVPAPGPPHHNTRARVEVESEACVQPAHRQQAHAHASADGRIVAARSSSTSHGDPTQPRFYPGQAGFGEQDDVSWASTLAGYPAPESVIVQVDTGLGDISSGIPSAGVWAAECLACIDGAMPCDVPVVGLGPESQSDFEGTHHAAPDEYLWGPPALMERWWGPALAASIPAGSTDSEPRIAPYEGQRPIGSVKLLSNLNDFQPPSHSPRLDECEDSSREDYMTTAVLGFETRYP
ncbi:uncharacterized protein TRAVEDRAFT_21257 [Trametes versicolor FP-101664 SS1]|uniref:uncharacterized protein n=1 Tax=Trametes versicolor (strain FP-101664) TaxID=717944 RepID=UPI00046215ED|nr:uncharacterized protein TRAVEDRAFT_21257 [Trametes versicolor FP-101664 SS1]EIW57723.1 hypothetical protein TRAVEDRAFT_21257 [Trametes versicolor FP-101664 SS1]